MVSLLVSACGDSGPGKQDERWEYEGEFRTLPEGNCWDVLVGPRGVLALDPEGKVTELRGLPPNESGEIWRNVLAEPTTMWTRVDPCAAKAVVPGEPRALLRFEPRSSGRWRTASTPDRPASG